jgi:hypothetical protein
LFDGVLAPLSTIYQQETDSLLLLLDPDQPVKADVHYEVYIIFDSRSNHCHLISDER